MRFRLGDQAYQVESMPFGWSMSPWFANKMAKPLQGWLHQHGIHHLWYVDDVLCLGRTKEETEVAAAKLVGLFNNTGICVNVAKSMLEASQSVEYLGHTLNLREHIITPQVEKCKKALQMVKHALSGTTCVPQVVAGLAGHLLDAIRSNVSLEGLPQRLLSLNSGMVRQQAVALGLPMAHPRCWALSRPKGRGVQDCLQRVKEALEAPVPRVLRPWLTQRYVLSTDASNQGWGAHLTLERVTMAHYAGFWDPKMAIRHITFLEVQASALGVSRALELIPDGCEIKLLVDSIATRHAWAKGTKLQHLNDLVTPVKQVLHRRHVFLKVEYLPGVLNVHADWLSRNQDSLDPANYTLVKRWFHVACNHFRFHPTVDLFASQLNNQVPRYCSWAWDPRSLGDAFHLDWSQELAWANPPFSIVGRMLDKIESDKATALIVVPMWRCQPWWLRLQKLQVVPPLVLSGRRIFRSPKGELLGVPKWATLFTVVQG